MIFTNNNYAHTKIYEIWIKNEFKYIGHTYLSVEQRLTQHLQDLITQYLHGIVKMKFK